MSDGPDALWAIKHVVCGGVAFLYLREPQRSEVIMAELAVFPDGTRPKNGELMYCAECGQHIALPHEELSW